MQTAALGYRQGVSSEDAARWQGAGTSEHELLEATRGHRAQLRSAIAQAADRVDEILARAQEIAEQIRDEAEREADRYLAARRLETERVVATQQAEARAAFESLSRQLDEIAAQARSSAATAAPEPAVDPGPALAPLAPPSTPSPAPAQVQAERRTDRSAALLLAGQLAVMGRDREEIEAALRVELGIERPHEIVDQILPPGDR